MIAFSNDIVEHMDEADVALFCLYRRQNAEPNGRSRDDLPYTEEFDMLLKQFNERMDSNLRPRELWIALRQLLKPKGEGPIENYLDGLGIEYQEKGPRKPTRA